MLTMVEAAHQKTQRHRQLSCHFGTSFSLEFRVFGFIAGRDIEEVVGSLCRFRAAASNKI
jgi:hypothetical protein